MFRDRFASLIPKAAACIAGALIPVLAFLAFLGMFLQPTDSPVFPTADAVNAHPASVNISHSQTRAQFADVGRPTKLYIAHHYHPYVKPKPAPPPPPPPPPAPVQPAGSYQDYALSLFSAYGWSSGEFSCLDSLWIRESGWNPGAVNPYSGATGIPQALPGSKMASAGADWATNGDTQIRWGLGYIHERYGTPCGAWNNELATGAY